MRSAAAFVAVALVGCDRIPDNTARDEARRAQTAVETLTSRVEVLERRERQALLLSRGSARLAPSDNSAWQAIDGGIGTFAVSLQKKSDSHSFLLRARS